MAPAFTTPSIAMTISMRFRQYSPTLSSFLHALVDEIVGQAVGPLLQLGVGELFVPGYDGDTVWHGVDGVLGKIGDIQGHGTKLERVTFRDKSVATKLEGGSSVSESQKGARRPH